MVANVNVNVNPPYVNDDGLKVYYDHAEAVVEKGGTLKTYDSENKSVYYVRYQDMALGTDATHNYILSYENKIPKNAYITKVAFRVSEIWDSAASTVALNFGLVKDDATKTTQHTIVDADGLMDTVPKTAIDTAGAIVWVFPADSLPAATTYIGAELGTIRAENQLVTCFWETQVPTAGSGVLEVYWRPNLRVL